MLAVSLIYALMTLVDHGRGAMARGHAVEIRGGAVHGGAPRALGRRAADGADPVVGVRIDLRAGAGLQPHPLRRRAGRLFLTPFAKLHPTGDFPHVGSLTIGGLAMAASLLTLEWVLSALMTARIVMQFIGQICGVHFIRTRRPDIARPFRMWLYPLPSLVALAGWSYIFVTSGWRFALYGVLVLASGVVAFAVWRAALQWGRVPPDVIVHRGGRRADVVEGLGVFQAVLLAGFAVGGEDEFADVVAVGGGVVGAEQGQAELSAPVRRGGARRSRPPGPGRGWPGSRRSSCPRSGSMSTTRLTSWGPRAK